jgi:hypothetical protein
VYSFRASLTEWSTSFQVREWLFHDPVWRRSSVPLPTEWRSYFDREHGDRRRAEYGKLKSKRHGKATHCCLILLTTTVLWIGHRSSSFLHDRLLQGKNNRLLCSRRPVNVASRRAKILSAGPRENFHSMVKLRPLSTLFVATGPQSWKRRERLREERKKKLHQQNVSTANHGDTSRRDATFDSSCVSISCAWL